MGGIEGTPATLLIDAFAAAVIVINTDVSAIEPARAPVMVCMLLDSSEYKDW